MSSSSESGLSSEVHVLEEGDCALTEANRISASDVGVILDECESLFARIRRHDDANSTRAQEATSCRSSESQHEVGVPILNVCPSWSSQLGLICFPSTHVPLAEPRSESIHRPFSKFSSP